MSRYELTDAQWQAIEPLCAGKKSDVGRTAQDNRLFINAVLFIARSGCAWRDLPERYGKWNSVFQRFNRWAKRGRWIAIFQTLRQMNAPDLDAAMLDSTTVRAHQRASGQKKKTRKATPPPKRASGRSRGGLTTKLRAVVDGRGSPIRLLLSEGQTADISVAPRLMAGIDSKAVLADKGYDCNAFVAELLRVNADRRIVIPSKTNRLRPRALDKRLYKERNKIERFFNRLKHYRRIATRYDKTARNFLAFVYLASAIFLIVNTT